MKQIFIISSIICLLFSCENRNLMEVDCPADLPNIQPAACNSTLCLNDTCKAYQVIWGHLFRERNNMTQEYFENHIIPCESRIDKWNSGISYRINYIVRIEWTEVMLHDQFIIWLDPSTSGLYPSVSLPRSSLLTENHINSVLNIMAFSSGMNTVSAVKQLKYTSFNAAKNSLIRKADVNRFCSYSIFYERPHMVVPPAGHPFLRAEGSIVGDENNCMVASIDLVTGEHDIAMNPCIIWFCFAKGTQIMLPGGISKPIEEIKVYDTIISVNLQTMSPDTDIVLGINSVAHDNIIQIEFSDGTKNKNTSDHPYYVEGKGWCSFSPSETLQKYGIKTGQLMIGDSCYKYAGIDLTMVKVKSIIKQKGKVKTYNISCLQKNKTYFANQILVSTEQN